jgi:hypothetical protein
MRDLALSVMAEIELRAQVESRNRIAVDLRLSEARTQSIIDTAYLYHELTGASL